jgi:IMP dehydrogenase
VNWGADAVKVGIGPGEVCTTRKVTPFGVPQFTAIQDCAKISKEMKVPMIADGGIRSSRDITLALAAGASSVMIGGLLARADESPHDNWFRGQASANFQEGYYGQVKEGTVPEGIAKHVSPAGPVQGVLDELLAGVRSGMTYGGATTIRELQDKAEFMTVTGHYLD